jgi:hypothetical protein
MDAVPIVPPLFWGTKNTTLHELQTGDRSRATDTDFKGLLREPNYPNKLAFVFLRSISGFLPCQATRPSQRARRIKTAHYYLKCLDYLKCLGSERARRTFGANSKSGS